MRRTGRRSRRQKRRKNCSRHRFGPSRLGRRFHTEGARRSPRCDILIGGQRGLGLPRGAEAEAAPRGAGGVGAACLWQVVNSLNALTDKLGSVRRPR